MTEHKHPKSAAARRWIGRRRALPGFPWLGRFESRAEVSAYFDGDRLTCLLCGRRLRTLNSHLPKIHQVTDDQYREMYGIPWREGLVSRDCRATYAASVTAERRAAAASRLLEITHTLTSEMRRRQRPPPAWVRKASGERGAMMSRGAGPYQAEDFEEFLRRLVAGRSPADVSTDADMPHVKTWRERRRADRDYNARCAAAIEGLPFTLQAQLGRLGERFKAEVRRLSATGKNDRMIAAELGVSIMACNRITAPMRRRASAHAEHESIAG